MSNILCHIIITIIIITLLIKCKIEFILLERYFVTKDNDHDGIIMLFSVFYFSKCNRHVIMMTNNITAERSSNLHIIILNCVKDDKPSIKSTFKPLKCNEIFLEQ